jgi:hypothetical protein
MGLELISLLAEVDVESGQASAMLVTVAIGILFAAGAVKCGVIMARPQAHTMCVGSLAALLLTFVFYSASNMLEILFELPTSLTIASHLLGMLAMLFAWTMAVLGLLDYRRHQESYNQGRVQAWIALGFSSLPVVLFVVGFSVSFVQGVLAARDRNAQNYADENAEPDAEESEFAKRRSADEEFAPDADSDPPHRQVSHNIAAREANTKTTQRFPQLNF